MADKEIRQDQYDIELPQSIIESFARFLVPKIRKYYNSEQDVYKRQVQGRCAGACQSVQAIHAGTVVAFWCRMLSVPCCLTQMEICCSAI